MTPLNKEIARSLGILHRGRSLVVKFAAEGVYIKGQRERWSSAYLVPWASIYDLGGKLKAQQLKAEKKLRKKFLK